MTNKIRLRIDAKNTSVADDIEDAIERGIRNSLGAGAGDGGLPEAIEQAATMKILEHERVWRGELVSSFNIDVYPEGDDWVAVVENDAPYARTTEEGRTPGQPTPLEPLIPWVKDHLDGWDIDIDYDDDDSGIGGTTLSSAGEAPSFDYDAEYVNAYKSENFLADPDAVDSWKEGQESKLATNADDLNLGDEEYQEKLQREYERLVEDTDVRTRVHYDNFEQILEDGRVKSQHETGESGGALNPSYRKRFESKWMGYNEREMPDEKRPIYGYLMPSSRDDDIPEVAGYGSVRIQYDDSVRSVTTFIFGDSFDKNAQFATDDWRTGDAQSLATWLDNPTITAQEVRAALRDPETQLEKLQQLRTVAEVVPYAEAQIHDGAATVDRIDEVVFTERGPTEKMIQLLERNNIDWRVQDS